MNQNKSLPLLYFLLFLSYILEAQKLVLFSAQVQIMVVKPLYTEASVYVISVFIHLI